MMRPAVALLGVLLLAGCTVAPPPDVTPSPTPTVASLPEPPYGVVGSGSLDGLPFEVTWDGSEFLLTGLQSLPGGTVQISAAQPVVGQCTDGYTLEFGLPFTVPLPLARATETRDPSFLTAVSIVDAYTNDCYGFPVLSTAQIVWTLQPLYPNLVVADSGETGGAIGTVAFEGETPVSYTVNQGDVLEEIAARFGLTTDQLVWLNPRRPNQKIVYKDETLNLSPSRR